MPLATTLTGHLRQTVAAPTIAGEGRALIPPQAAAILLQAARTRPHHTLRLLLVGDRPEEGVRRVLVVEVEAAQGRTAAKPQSGFRIQVRLQHWSTLKRKEPATRAGFFYL